MIGHYLTEIASFIVGLLSGSLITMKIKNRKANSATGGSIAVDQSKSTAGRDMVGGSNTIQQ